MKDIKFKFDIKSLAKQMARSAGWLFFCVVAVLIIMEILEVKNSVTVVLGVGQSQVTQDQQKGVRIDFAGYNQILARIQAAQNFTPTATITEDPFSAPVPQGSPTQ